MATKAGNAAYAAGCTIGHILKGKVDDETLAEIMRIMRLLETEVDREQS